MTEAWTKPEGDGWESIPFLQIAQKTAPDGDWHWVISEKPKLFLEDGQGHRWQFKLARGAWIRRVLIDTTEHGAR